MSVLYYRTIDIYTAFLHPSIPSKNAGQDVDFDDATYIFHVRNSWFNYNKVKADGSDIAFYQKVNGSWQVIKSYLWTWNFGGTSVFILGLKNVKHDEDVEVIMEYGKDYVEPSSVTRDTGQTSNILDVVEYFDDFTSFDSNKWYAPDNYSIGSSKITFSNNVSHNPIYHPNFRTKKTYNPLHYGIYFKGQFQYGTYAVTDDLGFGVYWSINNSQEVAGFMHGAPGYDGGVNNWLGYWICGDHSYQGQFGGGAWYIGSELEQIYELHLKQDENEYVWFTGSTSTSNTLEFSGSMDRNVSAKLGSFGFHGNQDNEATLDWVMIFTNQWYWGGLDIGPEVEPTLVIEEPIDNICSLIPNIRVVAENWLDSGSINLDVKIETHPYGEECISFLNNIMTDADESAIIRAFWEYKMQEPDDFLARGNFKIIATADNGFGFVMETEELFVIENCYASYRFTELLRDFDNFNATVKFTLENETEERVNIKNFLQNVNKNNVLVPINIIDSEEQYKDNYLMGIKTTPVEEELYNFKFDFAQDEVYDALNKKEVYVDSRVVIYNYEDAEWDVSSFCKEYSFDRDSDLGAVELSVTLDLNATLSPFYETGEPYCFYGNKIIVYQKLKKIDGTIYEQKKFTGYVREASVTKVAIHLVAHDKFVNFQRKTNEDIHISPDKVFVDEYLTTFDGNKFKSSYSGWAEYPPPRIFLGGKQLQPGEYAIDYPRGIVYLFRNTLISGDVRTIELDVDDFPDRKNFDLGFSIDYSSSPEVTHIWEEKEDYTCIGGIGTDDVWIERYDSLTLDDYYIDYDNNKLILYVPIPVDTADQRNHRLIISARQVLRVKAKYYYQEEDTNQVEDILYDLAKQVGFDEETELKDEITERIYKGSGNIVYTAKNNIDTINLLEVNGLGVDFGDWEYNNPENNKLGKIVFDEDININIIEAPLDAIVSLQHASADSGVTLSLDIDDYYYADACIKAENITSTKWIEIDYNRHFFYKTMGKYGKLGIYVKPEKYCRTTFEVYDSVEGMRSVTKTTPAEEWTLIELNPNGVALTQITKIRLFFTEILPSEPLTVRFDYFHIGEDVIDVTYKYNTLQNTDITVSEAWYLKEEIDSYMDIVDDLLEQVEPSYLVYVDENGKLRGEYTKVSSYVLKGQVIKRVFVDVEDYAGYFYLPDFYMKMIRTASTSVSDEEIYTAVTILGKLADKNNVALYTDTDDKCSWAPGQSYGINKNGTLNDFIKYIPPDVPAILIKKMQQGAPDTYEGLALCDGDVWSGVNWYLTSQDGNAGNVTKNSYMVKVTLREPILFEQIAICVGAYQNKKIREEIYIELEDEIGNKWYPSGEFPNKQNGGTGTWLRWESDFNKNRKVKYIHIYCAEPHYWITSTKISNSKK